MKKIISFILVALMLVNLVACSNVADDSEFPNKDVTYVIPYAAGGSSDQMARAMSNYFKEYAGVNLILENEPGGGGNVGLTNFAQSSPDGYKLASFNTSANLQPIYGVTQYDYKDVFEPLALVVSIPIAITVPGDSPFDSVEDLIEHAKQNPGDLQYGHAGIGSITHITAELFKQEAEIDMEQVPFSSGNDALTALLGGHIDVNIASFSEVWGQHTQGLVKILGLCTDIEKEDIPTLRSLGYDVDMKITQGVCTLKDVEEERLVKLDEVFNKIVNDENYQKELSDLGMEVDYLNREEFKTFIDEQREIFEDVVSASGIDVLVKENLN